MTPQFLPSIAPLVDKYDAFILDLWGVIHDGTQLYIGVKECLEALRAKNKKIIFLSNAPRRAQVVEDALLRMGITADLFDKVITSGETAYQCLANPDFAFFKPQGKRYFFIGLERDQGILGGLDYEKVESPESADFLLLSHPYFDNQPYSELLPLLERCKKQNIPALCINPDLEVVRIGGQHVYCAGALAEEYKKMGGEVIYFGKPHKAVYDACFALFVGIEQPRIVAVGDNLATDITGANKVHIDSVLVTGGVLRASMDQLNGQAYEEKCLQLISTAKASPTYIVPTFNF